MLCRSCHRSAHHLAKVPERLYGTRGRRYQSTSATRPLKVAIIGAGPSGFYTASRILSLLPSSNDKGEDVQVHMYERLPTPYGLVRYGVAPDHPEVKNCQHKFDELSADPRFKYFGNVSVGSQPSASPSTPSPTTTLSSYTYPHALHLPLASLLPYYSTVIFTYGASLSNPLHSVTGSSSSPAPMDGVFPALALVGWYNGHPAFSHLSAAVAKTISSRAAEDVAVVGQGNVALDVARILLKPLSELAKTDIPTTVVDVLSQSLVKRVSVVGRRGPGQVAFTTKEFREMLKLPGVRYDGLANLDTALLQGARESVESDRPRKRLLGLMEGGNGVTGDKEFKLEFLRSPKAFLAQPAETGYDTHARNDSVGSVEWTINELLEPPPPMPPAPSSQTSAVPNTTRPPPIARATSETVTTPAGMVVESVGYRSEPLGVGEQTTLPFDVGRGRARNVGGRLVDEEGVAVPGLYAAGWVARGPVGVIASTMNDAYALTTIVIDDYFGASDSASSSASLRTPEDGIPDAVARGVRDGQVITLDKWQNIDRAEVERAKGSDKEREKFTTVEEMMAAA